MEKMSILIVDDEVRFLTTTQKLLVRRGIDVLIASSGSEALDILETHPVHVVILDVKMPGMDGMETLRDIKRRFPLVEVVMLTGHATVESAIEGLKSGATDYLVKPTDIEELVSIAQEAFERRRRLEEKIRGAESRRFLKSPSELMKSAI